MAKSLGIQARGVPAFPELLYFDELLLVDRRGHGARENFLNVLEQHGVLVDPIQIFKTQEQEAAYKEESGRLLWFTQQATKVLAEDNPEFWKYVYSRIATELSPAEADLFAKGVGLPPPSEPRHRPPESSETQRAPNQRAMDDVRLIIDDMRAAPLRRAVELNSDYEPTTILDGAIHDNRQQQAVLEVVFKRFPVPTTETPIQEILSFRSDEKAVASRKRLQRWVREVASKEKRPREIEDELDELLASYTEHMKFHKMKLGFGTFSSFISTSLGVLENAIRLKFKDAFDLALRSHNLALTEAEMKAPGRKVAYLAQAVERFQ